MAGKSNIEWCTDTWNPIAGCSIVSAGCRFCYAMRMAARLEAIGVPHYEGTTTKVNRKAVWTGKVALAPEHILVAPLRWKRPRKIFVNSMGDLFHESVPDEWIDRVFAVMALCPQHVFQLLTKRAERMREYCTSLSESERHFERLCDAASLITNEPEHTHVEDVTLPLVNCWLGVSAERQQEADERIPHLLETPAAVRFVSAEPLLAPINLDNYRGLSLVIVGGESGPGARPMHPQWPRDIRGHCKAAGVPFFFKQWGEWASHYRKNMGVGEMVFRQFSSFDQWVDKASSWVNGGICLDAQGNELKRGADFMMARGENRFPVTIMHRVGKARAGRLLDGVEHNELPQHGA